MSKSKNTAPAATATPEDVVGDAELIDLARVLQPDGAFSVVVGPYKGSGERTRFARWKQATMLKGTAQVAQGDGETERDAREKLRDILRGSLFSAGTRFLHDALDDDGELARMEERAVKIRLHRDALRRQSTRVLLGHVAATGRPLALLQAASLRGLRVTLRRNAVEPAETAYGELRVTTDSMRSYMIATPLDGQPEWGLNAILEITRFESEHARPDAVQGCWHGLLVFPDLDRLLFLPRRHLPNCPYAEIALPPFELAAQLPDRFRLLDHGALALCEAPPYEVIP